MRCWKSVALTLVSLCVVAGCNSDGASSSISAPQSSSKDVSGSATLSWEAPTTTTSGETLTNLSGYRIYYGLDEQDLGQTVDLSGVGLQTYVIDNLGQGTWYFAIKAVTSAGVESALSNIVSKTIQ